MVNMAKIRTEFRYEEESYELVDQTKNQNVKLFINSVRQDTCLVTDSQLEVLFKIQAESSQNLGYIVNCGLN